MIELKTSKAGEDLAIAQSSGEFMTQMNIFLTFQTITLKLGNLTYFKVPHWFHVKSKKKKGLFYWMPVK